MSMARPWFLALSSCIGSACLFAACPSPTTEAVDGASEAPVAQAAPSPPAPSLPPAVAPDAGPSAEDLRLSAELQKIWTGVRAQVIALATPSGDSRPVLDVAKQAEANVAALRGWKKAPGVESAILDAFRAYRQCVALRAETPQGCAQAAWADHEGVKQCRRRMFWFKTASTHFLRGRKCDPLRIFQSAQTADIQLAHVSHLCEALRQSKASECQFLRVDELRLCTAIVSGNVTGCGRLPDLTAARQCRDFARAVRTLGADATGEIEQIENGALRALLEGIAQPESDCTAVLPRALDTRSAPYFEREPPETPAAPTALPEPAPRRTRR